MKNLFLKFFFIEMESFLFPVFLGLVIEDIFPESEEESKTKKEDVELGSDEKSSPLRLEWLKCYEEPNLISREIESIERTKKLGNKVALFILLM